MPDSGGTARDSDAAARATASAEQARALDLVRRYGWNATSYQVLQRGFEYFFLGDEACVGYVDTRSAWVAAGAPLCEPSRLQEVVTAFIEAARARGRRVCFFGVEERFASAVSLRSLLIGEQAVWKPALWESTVKAVPSLREQLRRARSKGVRVREATAAELSRAGSPTAAAVSELVRRWMDRHEMAPMGFLVDFDPRAASEEHRLTLAEVFEDSASLDSPAPELGHADGDQDAPAPPPAPPSARRRLVGLLVASPIFARRGWLLQALVRAPDAPNGTAELLVDEAMRAAAREEDSLVTLGLAPLAGEVAPPLRWARTASSALFDFQGLHSFKAKLRPLRWDPLYLSFQPQQSVVAALLDVLRAFARGRLLRFGIQTLLRGPAIVVRLLALALIPWTVALAATDADRWFPHPAVKWGWVVFDAILVVGLLALMRGRRWRDWLARLLLFAVGADVAITALEAALWNAPRVTTLGEGFTLVLAVLAPLLAFIVLWRARARRS